MLMNRIHFFKQYRQAMLGFWTVRTGREQFWLMLGAGIILAGLTYGVLIAPAWTARAQLQRTIPTVRMQAGELQALLKEANTLRAQKSVTGRDQTVFSREALEQMLSSKGVPANSVVILDNQIKIQWASVSFSEWMNGLAAIQKMFALSVEDVVIHPEGKKGWVHVDGTLRRQNSE